LWKLQRRPLSRIIKPSLETQISRSWRRIGLSFKSALASFRPPKSGKSLDARIRRLEFDAGQRFFMLTEAVNAAFFFFFFPQFTDLPAFRVRASRLDNFKKLIDERIVHRSWPLTNGYQGTAAGAKGLRPALNERPRDKTASAAALKEKRHRRACVSARPPLSLRRLQVDCLIPRVSDFQLSVNFL